MHTYCIDENELFSTRFSCDSMNVFLRRSNNIIPCVLNICTECLATIKLQTAEKLFIMEMLTMSIELCLLQKLVYHISSQSITVQLCISENKMCNNRSCAVAGMFVCKERSNYGNKNCVLCTKKSRLLLIQISSQRSLHLETL